jgi:hypothetical protein
VGELRNAWVAGPPSRSGTVPPPATVVIVPAEETFRIRPFQSAM